MKFISVIMLLASVTQAIKIDGKLDPEISLAEKEYFAHEGDEDLIKEDEYSQDEIDDIVKKGK